MEAAIEAKKDGCIRNVLFEEHEPGLFPNPDDSFNTGLYKSQDLIDWQKQKTKN